VIVPAVEVLNPPESLGLVSVAEVAAHMLSGVAVNEQLVGSLINAVSNAFDVYTDRRFIRARYAATVHVRDRKDQFSVLNRPVSRREFRVLHGAMEVQDLCLEDAQWGDVRVSGSRFVGTTLRMEWWGGYVPSWQIRTWEPDCNLEVGSWVRPRSRSASSLLFQVEIPGRTDAPEPVWPRVFSSSHRVASGSAQLGSWDACELPAMLRQLAIASVSEMYHGCLRDPAVASLNMEGIAASYRQSQMLPDGIKAALRRWRTEP
jgi:hypothetical protein